MSQPGWHPDPEGTDQLRWWDGQQWTSATQMRRQAPTPPPPAPEKVPSTPEQKRRNYILVGVAAVAVVGFVAFNSWRDAKPDEPARAASTSEESTTTSSAPATTTTRTRIAPVAPTYVPPARSVPAPAAEPVFDDEDTYILTLSISDYDFSDPRAKLIYSGHFACEQLDQGKDPNTVAAAMYVSNADWTLEQSGYLMGVAIASFCPEYR